MTALAIRRRIKLGPALRITPLPVGGLVLSAAMHAALIVALVIAVNALKRNQSQTIMVTLVPAVAAIGSPQGERSAPPASAPVTPSPPAPRSQPTSRESAPPELPARRDLPPPDLPPRRTTRDAMSLPERTLPARSAATPTPPRPEQKELPTVASARSTTPVAPPSRPPAPASTTTSSSPSTSLGPAAPPQPLGQPTGSPLGSGKLTLDVDFPDAWYLRALVNKIGERWDERALPGNEDKQPLIVFEIDRQGRVNVNRIKVEKSSGNPAYDQIALRAILDSSPFPPLPADFKGSSLTPHLQFLYGRGG